MSAEAASKFNDRFLRACRREPVDRTPVWFMRQAGRYLPEYRELREGRDVLELSRTPDLVVEATLQPLHRMPVDAAILFSDIMVPLAAIGVGVSIDAGGQAVQIFDSGVGVLDPDDYALFVLPVMREIFDGLADAGVPLIHFGVGTGELLTLMRDAGASVMGVDWRVPLHEAWERVGFDVAVQGNLDPAVCLAPWEAVEPKALAVLRRAAGRPAHIFNLGHGVLPGTPVETLQRLVELVHERTER